MSPVKFCPEHGPYDASFESCPQCGGKPSAPQALNDMDELETDIGFAYPQPNTDHENTEIPNRGGYREPETGTTVLGSEIGREMDQTQLDGSRPALVDAIFWVKEGNRRGRYYPIKHGTVIGRREGNLILDDLKVSSTHAKITAVGKKYTIWDFGSANGTFVNGKRISEATQIDENDEVKVGDTVFVLKLLSAKKKKPRSTAAKAKPKTARKTTASKASTPAKPKEDKPAAKK